jgi:ectoine hydroxylase-related dioxygenase (phytanoyl-CoA dioxygenase family)
MLIEPVKSSRPLTELPSFVPAEPGAPGEDAIQAYERDGVTCLRGAFEPRWIELLADGMENAIRAGTQEQKKSGPQVGLEGEKVFNVGKPGESGAFFYDSFMWQHMDQFRELIFESPIANYAMRIMRSKTLIFYFDFMLVKEPSTGMVTPWHYDESYWPISGDQACNLWLSLDHMPVETVLHFVRGSHRWERSYRAVHFANQTNPKIDYANLPDLPRVPNWHLEPGDHEIVYAPLEPGDCLIFHNRTHHFGPGNSLTSTRRRALATHWFGDDVRYDDKLQETDPPYRGENLIHGGSMECETFARMR